MAMVDSPMDVGEFNPNGSGLSKKMRGGSLELALIKQYLNWIGKYVNPVSGNSMDKGTDQVRWVRQSTCSQYSRAMIRSSCE